MSGNLVQSVPLPGGTGGNRIQGRGGNALVAPLTHIDLTQSEDVALVYRALVGRWDIPAPVWNAIAEQIPRAIEFQRRRAEEGDARAPRRMLHLVQLAVSLQARWQMEVAGSPKSVYPSFRRRNPEKPRRRLPRLCHCPLER